MAGGYFKPSVYIIVIAVLGMELIRFLRNVREGWKLFWPGVLLTVFFAFSQLAWIFCQLGICGIFLCGKEEREKYAVLVLSFLGIFLYQMLFEARARYLFVFLPVLIVIWACGMQQLASRITAVCRKKRALA